MKMGTIVSPWHYDWALDSSRLLTNLRWNSITHQVARFALRLTIEITGARLALA
jgi:hypothetical protein